MSEEGELKRRLGDVRFTLGSEYGEGMPLKERWIVKSQIHIIINEAAKEFPILEPIKVGYSMPMLEHLKLAEINAAKYILEVEKWRKKWLPKEVRKE